jgi:DNA-binding transcriptional LysR family regulator
MELRQLKYFVAVAEELHFTRAAERLRMAQPPLSRQINQLERELKVRLFRRTKRKVELTQAGALFLPQALETLRQAELALLTAQRAERGEVGLLNIATTSSMPFMDLLPRILHAYRQSFPHVHVVLQEQNTSEQLANLYEGAVDIGFLRLPVRVLPERISVETIHSEPLCLALREDHPLASARDIDLRRLENEALIMYPADLGGGLHDLCVSLCKNAGFVPKVEQEAKTVPVAVSFAAAGLGLAFVPASIRNVHTPGVIYRPLKQPSAKAEIAIAYRNNDRSARVKAFVKLSFALRANGTAQ